MTASTVHVLALPVRRLILVGIALLFCALNLAAVLLSNSTTKKQSNAHDESILSTATNRMSAASVKAANTAENAHFSSSSASSSSPWTIDIISIGSKTRPHYQKAQLNTFGSHPAVRNFFNIHEVNDTETACHDHLTLDQVHQIRYYCGRRRKPDYPLLNYFARLYASPQYLAKKSNAAGWMW